MSKRLSSSKSITLFRFYKDFETAKERVRILKNFDPDVPVHGLYGGPQESLDEAINTLGGSMESIWNFEPAKPPRWKWRHTDLMQKAWFRDFGHKIDFDFMFSYEYDLLTCDSLFSLYPDIDDNTLALSAVELLDKVEDRWDWTTKEELRPDFIKFLGYMKEQYGLERQKYVCLGPGPLLPRRFIEKFASTKDVELVHEELTYPAYAEVFGFRLADNGMHPGFFRTKEEEKLFNCNGYEPTLDEIFGQLGSADGRRSFHPVKIQIKLEDIVDRLAPKLA